MRKKCVLAAIDAKGRLRGKWIGKIERKKLIELIDGAKLIDMLENLKLGLKPVQAYEVDHAFFDAFNKP